MRARRPQPLPVEAFEGLVTQLELGCPACAARLTLGEDESSTHCGYCGRSYIVVVEGGPLKAYVAPTVQAETAERNAKTWLRTNGHRATNVGNGYWLLCPYWHTQSKAFKWFEAARQSPGSEAETFRDLNIQSFDFSFPASEVDTGRPNLGLHQEAMTLRPFLPSLCSWANIAKVQLGADAARAQARQRIEAWTQNDRMEIIEERSTLIDERSRLIYFPFYVLPYQFRDQVHQVLVDGITGDVTNHSGEQRIQLEETEAAAEPTDTQTIASQVAFLPACCPTCKEDFRPEAQDVVFTCGRCKHAWEFNGGVARRIEQRLGDNGVEGPNARILPFWALEVRAPGWKGDPRHASDHRVYVPAFENRHIERMGQLGIHLSRSTAEFEWRESDTPLAGCTVRLDDALRMVWVMTGTLVSADAEAFGTFLAQGPVALGDVELHWIPFRPSGLYLRDPKSGALIRETSMKRGASEAQDLAA